MFDFVDIAVVAGMMFLRIGVPLLVILALGYGLKRLDRRWEAEARRDAAKMATEETAQQPNIPAPQPARRPGKQPPAPQPLPFVPPAVNEEQRPGLHAQLGLPVSPTRSDRKMSNEAKMQACAGSSTSDQPCWQVRFNAEGHIPEECVTCDIFQRYPSM